MNFTLDLFYIFSTTLIISSLVVVGSKNAVRSVMFLILAFFNAAGLFIILGAEFLAMLLVIVYVGAIAVLFLFVVMMLNVDREEFKSEFNQHLPLLIMVAIVLFSEIMLIVNFSSVKFYDVKTLFPTPDNINNTKAIGNLLYTDFVLPFELSGAILFVAMIGAIVLTLKEETRFIKKQKISDQVFRNKENSLKIVKVKSGEGINI